MPVGRPEYAAWAALLFVGAFACGSGATDNGFGDAGQGSDGSVGSDAFATDGGSGDDGHSLISDGATIDVAPDACSPVRIGIFGNPGSNPSSDFQMWLDSAGASATRVQTNPADALTPAVTAPFDVIILDNLVRDYSAAEAQVLQGWIQAGGGLVSMTGYVNDTSIDWRANVLLAPLEVAYSGSLILSGPVTNFVPHPTTMGLTSVTFDGGYVISDLGGANSTRTIVATLPEGPVAYAIQMGSGRAFVWGDEWIEYDSEWSTMPEIKQLWVNVFAWLAPMGKCGLHPPQ
jgi:hypothetical protein